MPIELIYGLPHGERDARLVEDFRAELAEAGRSLRPAVHWLVPNALVAAERRREILRRPAVSLGEGPKPTSTREKSSSEQEIASFGPLFREWAGLRNGLLWPGIRTPRQLVTALAGANPKVAHPVDRRQTEILIAELVAAAAKGKELGPLTSVADSHGLVELLAGAFGELGKFSVRKDQQKRAASPFFERGAGRRRRQTVRAVPHGDGKASSSG